MSTGIKTTLIIIALFSFCALAAWGLGDALFPLLISFGSAYLVFPLVKKLEVIGVHRSHAVLGIFSLMLAIFGMASVLIIPGLLADANALLTELPQFASRAIERVEELASGYGYKISLSAENIRTYLIEHISELSGGIIKGFSRGVFDAFASINNWLISILSFFLIPMFFFYLINDFEKIIDEIKSFFPQTIRPKMRHYFALSNRVLSGYVRGQLMVALVLSGLYGVGLSVIGLRFGILIGIGSGLISIVPYAGLAIGFVTAFLVGLAHHESSGTLLGIVVVFGLVQGLEAAIITPKLVGNTVGLSPLATMLALIIGANLAGLTGMLIAIPTAAIAKSILAELKQEYHRLDIFKT